MLVLARRSSGSAQPGNQCELSQPRTMNAYLPREFGAPRADKLKLALGRSRTLLVHAAVFQQIKSKI